MRAVFLNTNGRVAPASILLVEQELIDSLPMHTTNTLLLPVISCDDHLNNAFLNSMKPNRVRFTVTRESDRIEFTEESVAWEPRTGTFNF